MGLPEALRCIWLPAAPVRRGRQQLNSSNCGVNVSGEHVTLWETKDGEERHSGRAVLGGSSRASGATTAWHTVLGKDMTCWLDGKQRPVLPFFLCCCFVLLQLVVRAIESGDKIVLSDAHRIGQYKEGEAIEVQDLANRLFHTVFMGTENSSGDTRRRCARIEQLT